MPYLPSASSDEEDFLGDSARQRRGASHTNPQSRGPVQQAQPGTNNIPVPPGTRQAGSFSNVSYRERRSGPTPGGLKHESAGRQYEKTPDMAIVSRGTPVTLKAVGELKVPWIEARELGEKYHDLNYLRAIIGQVVEYMIDLKVPFRFHSTYDQTIFLRHI
ncbi:hypothetical protein PENARI_c001G01745 [Penicillium arizonense]|uniref:Uncharacterized protein n=1 Tax=Penicillium arizonense TaxID=1835702 RepID=A0A1F5LY33_PENAI|nr:hypothetical protein PENARI_c001G01745 [Penicillium arizonense]OGE58080.1 hypothetical protein PENARI_c001G01745 [Penicillium arizonense]